MTEPEILSCIQGLARDLFEDDSLVLTPEIRREQVEEWDSMNHVNLVVGLEATLGIKFDVSEIEALQSVGDIVAAIKQKAG